MNETELRKIPGVDTVLEATAFPRDFPPSLASNLVRSILGEIRESIRDGGSCPSLETIRERVAQDVDQLRANRIQPVLNATGVVLHTNLGRAPYAAPVLEAMRDVLGGYTNLEMELDEGRRGGRGLFGEHVLCQLTGAESAAIVNNCSAALLLALTTLARDEEVLISRGELVQIGGGFRIPEILETSGARLREVGTTNRTDVEDYRRGMDSGVGLILKVHRSNFKLVGFTSSPTPDELRPIAREHGVPLLCDLGSGALWDTAEAGLRSELRPGQLIESGVDLVTFSGDKLLGGPQAGLLVGRDEIVKTLKSNPMFRALRCGKATLAAVEQTLLEYVRDGGEALPVRTLLRTPVEELQNRVQDVLDRIDRPPSASGEAMEGAVGGGSLPGESVPGWGLAIETPDPEGILGRLRGEHPPVIGRIREGRVELNFRSLLPDQDDVLAGILARLLPLP